MIGCAQFEGGAGEIGHCGRPAVGGVFGLHDHRAIEFLDQGDAGAGFGDLSVDGPGGGDAVGQKPRDVHDPGQLAVAVRMAYHGMAEFVRVTDGSGLPVNGW